MHINQCELSFYFLFFINVKKKGLWHRSEGWSKCVGGRSLGTPGVGYLTVKGCVQVCVCVCSCAGRVGVDPACPTPSAAHRVLRHGDLPGLFRGGVSGLSHPAHQDQAEAEAEPGQCLHMGTRSHSLSLIHFHGLPLSFPLK